MYHEDNIEPLVKFFDEVLAELSKDMCIEHSNVSTHEYIGGPMICVFTLSLSEDMPSSQYLTEICDRVKMFCNSIHFEIPERSVGKFSISVEYMRDRYTTEGKTF